ncbi:MAG: HD domain-containing protein [Candidatus Levybacteria bacterium]|nr:HD domain-containing protein [Candidatus Levybacteria bacterium]
MNFDLDRIAIQIKSHRYFDLSKKVIENNENHKNDPINEHLNRTFEKAKEFSDGNLITNLQAKIEFKKILNNEISGIKKSDLLVITALLHDIGKIIIFLDGSKEIPLLKRKSNYNNSFPAHEYWGSILAREILTEIKLPPEAIDFICKCIRLHNAGFNVWFEDLSNEERLWEIKLRSENIHFELIFGTYCDLFYGADFQDKLQLPIGVLNMPETYQEIAIKTI